MKSDVFVKSVSYTNFEKAFNARRNLTVFYH